MRSKLIRAYQRWKQVKYAYVGTPTGKVKDGIVDFKPIAESTVEFAILCDGGLCNRLNCLVVGYYAARALNRRPVIIWPETEVCDCGLEKLLMAPGEIEIRREFSLDSVQEVFLIWHMEYRATDQIHPDAIKNWQHFEEILPEGKTMYGHSSLVRWVDLEAAFALFKREFGLNSWVQGQIDWFIEAEQVREAVGLHFRTTDFAITFESYQKLFQKALRTKRRVFVCSDAEEAESQAMALSPQLFRRDKAAYVDKKDEDQPWRVGETYNVYRSEMAIIDGMIDLYILSATQQQFGNLASTFFNFARYLRY